MKKLFLLMFAVANFASCQYSSETEKPVLPEPPSYSMRSGSTEPVKLFYAKIGDHQTAADPEGWMKTLAGDINIVNLGAEKEVLVAYSINNTVWKTFPAAFVKILNDGTELWRFEGDIIGLSGLHYPGDYYAQFAVVYKVNGTEYWDNNGGYGNDYRINLVRCHELYPDIVLAKSSMYHYDGSLYGEFDGKVAVKNIAYQKDLTLVYTTDNWKTKVTKKIDQYLNGDRFVDYFDWQIYHIPSILPEGDILIQYIINYTVNGVTYCNDNYGENYKLSPRIETFKYETMDIYVNGDSFSATPLPGYSKKQVNVFNDYPGADYCFIAVYSPYENESSCKVSEGKYLMGLLRFKGNYVNGLANPEYLTLDNKDIVSIRYANTFFPSTRFNGWCEFNTQSLFHN